MRVSAADEPSVSRVQSTSGAVRANSIQLSSWASCQANVRYVGESPGYIMNSQQIRAEAQDGAREGVHLETTLFMERNENGESAQLLDAECWLQRLMSGLTSSPPAPRRFCCPKLLSVRTECPFQWIIVREYQTCLVKEGGPVPCYKSSDLHFYSVHNYLLIIYTCAQCSHIISW